jgi:hypothetical protein
MKLGETIQLKWQFAGGAFPELAQPVRGIGQALGLIPFGPGPLLVDPGPLLLGKQLGMAARTPPGQGNPHRAIGAHTDYVTPGPGMADEIHERFTIVVGTDSE